jgi:aspartate racemase
MRTTLGASKCVGILGGMGPYATIDFQRSILMYTDANRESDHLRVLVDNNPKIPSRTRAYLTGDVDPVPYMKNGVVGLASSGADFIVVPCNSAHHFLPEVFDGLGIDYLSIVDVTTAKVVEKCYSKVGILAGEVTVGEQLYDKNLRPHGIEAVNVSGNRQKMVRDVIEDVKIGNTSDGTRTILGELVSDLIAKGAEAVIFGCTELQAVSGSDGFAVPIVDSVDQLARATVARALGST